MKHISNNVDVLSLDINLSKVMFNSGYLAIVHHTLCERLQAVIGCEVVDQKNSNEPSDVLFVCTCQVQLPSRYFRGEF